MRDLCERKNKGGNENKHKAESNEWTENLNQKLKIGQNKAG